MRECASCPHDLRAGFNPISAMSWGGEPVRRDQQANRLFEWQAFTLLCGIKQVKRQSSSKSPQKPASGSIQPADLFLGHHALDVLGLALDAVTGAAIRLDRQAGDNGIDAALLDDGTTLRPLQLVVDIVVDRVIMGHRSVFPVKMGLLVGKTKKRNKIRWLAEHRGRANGGWFGKKQLFAALQHGQGDPARGPTRPACFIRNEGKVAT
jgi:hypothetical protein